jgi:hypothetical protein
MPDEVIAGPVKYSGGARARPLFSFRHVFCSPKIARPVASSFETPRASAAPQDEVFQTLMVRSAATPRVSNHEAAGCQTMMLITRDLT